MKTYQKNVALCLLVAMLTSMAVSCGSGDTKETTGTDTDTTTTVQETETEKQPYVPTMSYGGAEVHILTPKSTTALIYLFADEENGDKLNDGVYQRNFMTEEWLGIDLTWEADCEIGDLAGLVQNAVLAGDDAYQIVLADSMRGNTAMVSGGMLLDMNTVESLDFSHEYWNASALQELTIDGKTYFAKSAYTLPNAAVVVFNKQMVTDMSLDVPYTLVREGTWTLDVFASMVEQGVLDLDGDGKMTINDQYGLTCMQDYPLDCFLYACGQTMVKLNDEGRMEVALYNDDSVSMYEKLYKLLNEGNKTFMWGWGAAEDKQLNMDSGRTLFEMYRTNELYQLRDCDLDYGIVPYPKLNEAQENYSMNDYSRLLCIPVTVAEPEMVGQTCEMLGYYSEEYVYPAYYGSLLEGKVARDEDTIEMLSLVFDSVIYDGGMSYFGLNGGGMQSLLYYVSTKVANGDNNFTSFYTAQAEKAQKEIDTFYESIE